MYNRRRKCEIARKCTKTTGQILGDIAEQTATSAQVAYFEVVKKHVCDCTVELV